MAFSAKNRANTLNGVWFVALFAIAALYLSELPGFRHLGISPLIIGIVLGMIYANTLRNKLPEAWVPGILFSTKVLLRVAIMLYGFRITFQDIITIGLPGLVVSITMVTTTFILGSYLGIKLFKLDKDIAILTAAGSSVCGAAAVLATEPVLKSEPYKSAIAVSTVILFGTIAMFLYPTLYKANFLNMDLKTFGIYIGGTLHEVAHTVAAGNAISDITSNNAVIVKMMRVMMIAPLLIILSIWLAKQNHNIKGDKKTKISIPWFAIIFVMVAGFNSLNILPKAAVKTINDLDTFALTMAMSALGMETSFRKFKGVGLKPIYLALIMFLWLIFGGYFITKNVVAIF
ncbi:YeiH family putative sulfate export transporter [Desulfohalobiaceae bacterium Ax17]|uniref:YeiH family protein n=1 Tax=Desulfovulcanus ferrireducens TaxID=2831190 RepID=UPI00207BA06A|nr:YeiH family protein [Desulfovulcanus ferrireducens]MBT8763681.1 YeiH family putative sulfate export transporter [Desulfovulcanus ferrireducens]